MTGGTGLRAERVVTSGQFTLDGQSWDVDNNVWLFGDDDEVVIIDAAHDAGAIAGAVGGRQVRAIICTHGHDDHIGAAPELSTLTGAPVLAHPDDAVLWTMTHPSRPPDGELNDRQSLEVAGSRLTVLHTPGHAPGAVCLHVPEAGLVFSGDTLFHGGPGATGRSFSDFRTIIDSISRRLLRLPEETVVHTGHGSDTTIGAEAPHVDDWITRGY